MSRYHWSIWFCFCFCGLCPDRVCPDTIGQYGFVFVFVVYVQTVYVQIPLVNMVLPMSLWFMFRPCTSRYQWSIWFCLCLCGLCPDRVCPDTSGLYGFAYVVVVVAYMVLLLSL